MFFFYAFRIHLTPDERRHVNSKCKKKTNNPNFEETFAFHASFRSFDERAICLTVYDYDRRKKHSIIGRALYPLKNVVDCESNDRLVAWRDLQKDDSGLPQPQGELRISLAFNDCLGLLTVSVFEGRKFRLEKKSMQNYYIKITYLLSNKVIKRKQSDIAKGDCPVFNESFTFKLANESVQDASVSISVMQRLSGQRKRQLGRVALGSHMFARGRELEHWNEMVAKKKERVEKWHKVY